MSEDIEARVKAIIAEDLGIDPRKITPDARIVEELGADSLDAVEIVMAMEEEFNFDTFDQEAEKVDTVQDTIDLVKKRRRSILQRGRAGFAKSAVAGSARTCHWILSPGARASCGTWVV